MCEAIAVAVAVALRLGRPQPLRPRPRRARAARSARGCRAPAWPATACTCALTVATLMNSSAPISAFEPPRAMASATSRSRSVSRAIASRARRRRASASASATCAISCRVIVGESIASPAATSLIARTISGGGVSLSRKPLAPARSARSTRSSASNVVRTITCGGSGDAAQRLRRREPVDPRHPDVHEHDVGRVRVDRGLDLVAVPHLADHGHVVAAREHHRQRAAHERVVVDDEDARHAHAGQGSHAQSRWSPAGVRPCSSRPPARCARSARPMIPAPEPGGTARSGR